MYECRSRSPPPPPPLVYIAFQPGNPPVLVCLCAYVPTLGTFYNLQSTLESPPKKRKKKRAAFRVSPSILTIPSPPQTSPLARRSNTNCQKSMHSIHGIIPRIMQIPRCQIKMQQNFPQRTRLGISRVMLEERNCIQRINEIATIPNFYIHGFEVFDVL